MQTVTLKDGTPAMIRTIGPDDAQALVRGLRALSPESRIRRFFYDKRGFSQRELERLTHPDGRDHLAYVLFVRDEAAGEMKPVAVARCFRSPEDPEMAEVAVVTSDDWQGLGVASALLQVLSKKALEVGIRRWFGALSADNAAVRRLLNRVGKPQLEQEVGRGVVEVVYEIADPE